MRLLVVGGTSFNGRALVEAALDQGHDVTLFNRGRTNSDLFPGVERRHGDRQTSDLKSLADGEWDAAVDVSGYQPRHVKEMATLLADRVGYYCFISTGAVYEPLADHIDEDAALKHLADPADETFNLETYGPLKVLCEQEVEAVFGGRASHIRLGIAVGPHDMTDRFTYWVRRLTRDGRVLGPPRADQPIQLIAATDEAAFVLGLVNSRTPGVFNVVGDPVTFEAMIDACAVVAGTSADVTWAPEDVLTKENVALPLALPASGGLDQMYRIANDRAKAAGLVVTPLADVAAATLGWDRTREQSAALSVGPAADAERAVLGKLM